MARVGPGARRGDWLRRGGVMAAAAMAAWLAACSEEDGAGGKATGGMAAKIDACGLLTAEEAGQALGFAVNPGREQHTAGGGENQGYMSTCVWETPDKEDTGALSFTEMLKDQGFVTLILWSWPAGSGGAQNYMNSMREGAEFYDMPTPEPVAIGEEATWDGSIVNVRQGDVSFTLSLTRLGSEAADADLATLEGLARNVLGRL